MYGGNSDDLANRTRQIEAQEARVRALEKELDDYETDIKEDSKGVRPIKNWPCKSYAFARNDIAMDIPIQSQKAVRKFYSLWWLTAICCIINWISIVWWASVYSSSASFQDYFFVTLYVVVGTPLSWMLLYKRFYRAMQQNGDLGSVFFFFLFAHLVWVVLMTIGFTTMDAAGWLVMSKVFVDQHHGLGFMMLVSSIAWSINCIATLYLMRVAQYSYGMFLANKHADMAQTFT
eukprot:38138_1